MPGLLFGYLFQSVIFVFFSAINYAFVFTVLSSFKFCKPESLGWTITYLFRPSCIAVLYQIVVCILVPWYLVFIFLVGIKPQILLHVSLGKILQIDITSNFILSQFDDWRRIIMSQFMDLPFWNSYEIDILHQQNFYLIFLTITKWKGNILKQNIIEQMFSIWSIVVSKRGYIGLVGLNLCKTVFNG